MPPSLHGNNRNSVVGRRYVSELTVVGLLVNLAVGERSISAFARLKPKGSIFAS
jgi:hypothetical protein